jgi:hypothetical protein
MKVIDPDNDVAIDIDDTNDSNNVSKSKQVTSKRKKEKKLSDTLTKEMVDSVVEATDIVELISESLPLKRTGSEHKACCPFHSERSPSFSVSESKQFYHCFGCGANGNAVTFAMEYLCFDFVDAVEFLADRAGIELNFKRSAPIRNYAKAKKVAEKPIESSAENKFHDALAKNGLSIDIAKENTVSYIEDNKGVESFIAEVSGPSLLFPVMDRRDRVIGFSLKNVVNNQLSIYPKDVLYGTEKTSRERFLFITSDPIDAIHVSSTGFDCVATSCDIPDKKQLQRILKMTPECVFCFGIGLQDYKKAWGLAKALLPLVSAKNHIRFLFYSDNLTGAIDEFIKQSSFAEDYSEFVIDNIMTLLADEVKANSKIALTEYYLTYRVDQFLSLMSDDIYKDMFADILKTVLISHFCKKSDTPAAPVAGV